jgi:outer membrane protein assembly factor BamB
MNRNQRFLIAGLLVVLGVALLSIVLILVSSAPTTSTALSGTHASPTVSYPTATPIPPARNIIFTTNKQNLDDLNATNGVLSWNHPFPVDPTYSWTGVKPELLLADGILFHVTIDGGNVPNTILSALNPTTGQILWTFNQNIYSAVPGAVLNHVAYVNGQLSASDANNNISTLFALDDHSGKVLWHLHDAYVVGSNGTLIFAANSQNQSLAIQPTNGAIIWRSSLSYFFEGPQANEFSVDPHFVFTMDSTRKKIVALNAADGSIAWQWASPSTTSANDYLALETISTNSVYMAIVPGYQSSDPVQIIVLNKNDGTVRSQYTDGQNGKVFVSNGFVTTNQGILDFGYHTVIGGQETLQVAHLDTGTPLWSYDCSQIGACQKFWLGASTLYVQMADGIVAFNLTSGTMVWHSQLWKTNTNAQISGLAIYNNILAFGVSFQLPNQTRNLTDTVYAMDTESGKLLWQHPLSGVVMTNPLILP